MVILHASSLVAGHFFNVCILLIDFSWQVGVKSFTYKIASMDDKSLYIYEWKWQNMWDVHQY